MDQCTDREPGRRNLKFQWMEMIIICHLNVICLHLHNALKPPVTLRRWNGPWAKWPLELHQCLIDGAEFAFVIIS